MVKNISLLIAAVAVAIFGAPASASASAATNGTGSLLPFGSVLTARSYNMVVFTTIGTFNCLETDLTNKLVGNEGGIVEMEAFGPGVTAGCESGGEPIKLNNVTMFMFASVSSGSGVSSLYFEAALPVIGTCGYEGFLLPVSYVVGSASIHLEGQLSATPLACGEAEIEGDFHLEQFGGGPVVID